METISPVRRNTITQWLSVKSKVVIVNILQSFHDMQQTPGKIKNCSAEFKRFFTLGTRQTYNPFCVPIKKRHNL